MENKEEKTGIFYITAAYILWGFLPIYWKLIDYVPADEILAHRIVWSFILMICIVLALRKWTPFVQECKRIFNNKKQLFCITSASIVISLNWLTYIWAVNSDYVIQASLGYYINPLVSILLGMLVLKETLTKRQWVSFAIAGIAVLYLTFSFGVFPWVSLVLAFTFGLYGLLKKMVDISAMFGLTIETMIVTPIAAIYLFAFPRQTISINSLSAGTGLLVIGAGIATAIPLLFFASGAKYIPLAMVGFLQYIAPTIMLMLGVFLFKETFSTAHFIAFALIWTALIIYMGSMTKSVKHQSSDG